MPAPTDSAFLGFKADATFVEQLDLGRGQVSRSQFLREAVAEKLKELGIDLPSESVIAPDRKGKGGRPRASSVTMLNDAPTKTKLPKPKSVTYRSTNKRHKHKRTEQEDGLSEP
jgi:hypothetical protein